MNNIGMTRNTVQQVQMQESSIEEQLNALHESLDSLNIALISLQENLSEVMCTTTHQGVNAVAETPVMSLTAERIFSADTRVRDNTLYINWLNANLNIKDKSNV